MALTLYVDTERWRAHHAASLVAYPRIVPVAKGNGYGFGLARLAREAARLGADTLAVGTYHELASVADEFPGDLLVLTPVRAFHGVGDGPQGAARTSGPGPSRSATDTDGVPEARIIQTVSRLADLQVLVDGPGEPRVVVELLTSMKRHGIPADDLPMVAKLLDGVRCEGWALHLPLPVAGAHRQEVESWIERFREADLPLDRLWVSHLTPQELAELTAAHPATEFRPRVGTKLWLADRDAFHAKAHVLDVHPVRRGERFGYRQRKVPGNGHLVVVSGGTAHGIAVEAPSHVGDLRTRAKTLALSGLEAAGRALSPFTIEDHRRWFAEPPHMQVSVLFLPSSVRPPEVGAELHVNVGMTFTTFDRIVMDEAVPGTP
ncbi:alanine racemase [Actinopolymorpha sp. B17G11]|uniref:alanine racemase n=1 Tax=Actinopolymorpha sp. B17G11 TaxID=3160861 RepID=UPI0032E41CC0